MKIRTLLSVILLVATAFLLPLTVQAETAVNPAPTFSQLARLNAERQSCLSPRTQRTSLSEVSQTDCCKNHKGVCGCRAGKIVCCDNSASPNCTCHSDWNIAD